MASPAVEELKSSLEWLYSTREFSDLQIITSERTHRVHKAVVCPRSTYFTDSCRDTASDIGNNVIIKLFEDDPKAIDAIIHYLYHLDYPSDTSLIVHKDVNGSNGVNGHNGINGVNGDQNNDDGQASVRGDEPPSSIDDFLPISKNAIKQRKKRARRKSMSRGSIDPPGTKTEVIIVQDGDNAESREGAPLNQPPVVVNGSGIHRPAGDGPTGKDEGGLVLHAKVYELSRKLGIESLQVLALQKFEGESEEQWASEGFVKAASEVSAVVAGSEVDEGKIRGIVLNVVCEHRELINKDGMENVIRSMDLGYDLVKQLMNRGLVPV